MKNLHFAKLGIVFFVNLLIVFEKSKETKADCEPAQYAELGSRWIAECSFHFEFISVYWYEWVTSEATTDPIILYENLEGGDAIASGEGYKNGQYGILPNGSLVIPYVTTEYEGTYKVVSIDNQFALHEYVFELEVLDLKTRVHCEPLQYTDLGSEWIAECSFPSEFISVDWYASVSSEFNIAPILRYEKFKVDNAVVSGDGYQTGHYGILSNGSLVITNVTIGNEGTFRVVVIDTQFVTHEFEFELKTRDLKTRTFCEPLQYVELGSKWIAICSFPIKFRSVYWYDSITSEYNTDPVLRYESGLDGFVASGEGYRMGLYDIQPNGSLVIPNVTIQNERIYVALVLDSSYTLLSYETELKVKVTSRRTFPLVNGCEKRTCLIAYQPGLVLQCSFMQVRPAANLSWYLKKGYSEERIDSPQITLPEGSVTYTSSIRINLTQIIMQWSVMELSCRVSGIQSMSSLVETLILIDNSDNALNELHPNTIIRKPVNLNNPTVLSCTDAKKPLTFIWKRVENHQPTVLAFSATSEGRVIVTSDAGVYVSKEGYLSINQCDISCEGHYMCVYTDGQSFDTTVYQIIVLIGPSPPYLIIDGCPNGLQKCTFHLTSSEATKNLTCSVHNVHPELILNLQSDHSMEITMSNQRNISMRNGYMFDITVHGELRLPQKLKCDVVPTVTCIASGSASSFFIPYKTIEVVNDKCQQSELPIDTEKELSNSKRREVIFSVSLVLVCLLLLLLLTRYFTNI